jgi:hypothetical protein
MSQEKLWQVGVATVTLAPHPIEERLMPSVGFVVPVLPGKEQADLDWMKEMTGPRREDYESSWKQLGVTRHAVWHQQTPDGMVAVVYMEADDIGRAMEGVASSDDPFHQWFRERVEDVHGIDLQSGPAPQSQQIHDHSF